MNQEILTVTLNNTKSFISIFINEKQNRRLLSIITGSVIIQFIIFKFFYPYPDFSNESVKHIYAASENLVVSVVPIGYSKILLAIHNLTHSSTALISFQYFAIEASCLYFFFSVLYFYNPSKTTRFILFVFFFFNPLFLYLSNTVTNDAIFLALSVCWITQIIWIVHSPKKSIIISHTVLLFTCFTLSNIAYYYPIISIVAFILSRQSIKWKITGIILPLFLICIFIINTLNKAETLTGGKQLSLYSGWQVANNALSMYPHIQVDSSKLPSTTSRELNQLSQIAFSPSVRFDTIVEYGGSSFLKFAQSPLIQYYLKHYHSKDSYLELINQGSTSIAFREYGNWLIANNPVSFAQYFIFPNAKNYFSPPLEKLAAYRIKLFFPSIQDWFDYETPEVKVSSRSIQGQILFIYPYFFFFLNILYVGGLFGILLKRKSIIIPSEYRNMLIISSLLLLLNFCIAVSTITIVFRYQVFPMIITLSLSVLIIEFLEKKETTFMPSRIQIDNKIYIKELTNVNL